MIHLKRFYHSAMRKEKLNTTVQFPDASLDMKKYAAFSSKCRNLISDLDHVTKNDGVYNLFGISHHSGSLYEGHYIR